MRLSHPWWWGAVAVMVVGALFTVGIDTQRALPLRVPLDEAIPTEIAGLEASRLELSDGERRVLAATDYVLRSYDAPADSGTAGSASLYVGYYDRQTQGKTIHSPKNCLPGAGWTALQSTPATVSTTTGGVTVNRYVVQNGEQQALVLYWYQGRGRVASNEYVVKWELLRDAALHGRSEEALVRIVVDIDESEDQAFDLAARIAATVVPSLAAALPG